MSTSPSATKWVAISGCDSGFGNLAVDLFAAEGYGVFAGVFLPESVAKLTKGNVVALSLNVTSEPSVLSFAQAIKSQLIKIPGAQLVGLVNNAGILVQPCPAEWQSTKDFRDMFEVNVLGMVSLTQACLPMIRASKGRIVCTSSIAGRMGIPTQAAYCASKYAVQGYADVLRRDMYAWGVTVHIVEPGVFPNTGLYERFEKGLDAVWARLDDSLKAEYGEEFYKYQRKRLGMALNELGTSDSSLVPKAYLHAITSDAPQYRYRVGLDSKYGITVLEKLHESTSDGLLTRGSPKLPLVRPATAPKDGKDIAMSRYEKNWPRFIVVVLAVAYVGYKIRNSRV